MTCPDTHDASSRAKNDTVAAMSSGCPTRATGISFAAAALKSSNGTPMRLAVLAVISVSMRPGDVDETGCDGVHRDPELAEFDRQGLGESLDAGLRGGVVRLAAVAERGHAGRLTIWPT